MAEIVPETPRATSIVLDLPGWPGHRAGQHVDVRLTAEDRYQAERSYSIASAPGDGYLVLTVERVPDGDVSSYLASGLRAGDQLELRGPIGGYFVWDDCAREPVLLVADGPGIVPFRSMLRHRQAAAGDVAVRLLYSARSLQDVIYRDELLRLAVRRDRHPLGPHARSAADLARSLRWVTAYRDSRPGDMAGGHECGTRPDRSNAGVFSGFTVVTLPASAAAGTS